MLKSLTLIAIIALTCIFIYFDGAFVLEESKEPIQVNQEYQKNSINTYIINLDRATERLEKITPMATQLGFPHERIPAVDGKNIPQETIDKVVSDASYVNYVNSPLNVGSIGCYMSHINTWEKFLQSDYEYALNRFVNFK